MKGKVSSRYYLITLETTRRSNFYLSSAKEKVGIIIIPRLRHKKLPQDKTNSFNPHFGCKVVSSSPFNISRPHRRLP